jgi:cytidyltransferase-like protein
MILYVDMVADLLHYGHINFIKKIHDYKNEGDELYVGIHNDETVEEYKRKPILTMDERIKALESCKYIDKIIPDAPLKITDDYLKLHGIHKIFIPNNRTDQDNLLMLSSIKDKTTIEIITIPYTTTISTSEIIHRIINTGVVGACGAEESPPP